MKLSVIIPVYNEEATIGEILRRVIAVPVEKEIIIVDDGSDDGTAEILKNLPAEAKVVRHDKNMGKGRAVRTGLEQVSGDIVVIQDADLEYNPAEYPRLIAPIKNGLADVVYGSRNLRKNPRSGLLFYWGGVFLSKLANLLYGTCITDEATGYKAFKTEVIKKLDLKSSGFEFCPEVTARLARAGYKIHEVPISYAPRGRSEGKKITFKDGAVAVASLIRHRFF